MTTQGNLNLTVPFPRAFSAECTSGCHFIFMVVSVLLLVLVLILCRSHVTLSDEFEENLYYSSMMTRRNPDLTVPLP